MIQSDEMLVVTKLFEQLHAEISELRNSQKQVVGSLENISKTIVEDYVQS
jgi:hypothetical protein